MEYLLLLLLSSLYGQAVHTEDMKQAGFALNIVSAESMFHYIQQHWHIFHEQLPTLLYPFQVCTVTHLSSNDPEEKARPLP